MSPSSPNRFYARLTGTAVIILLGTVLTSAFSQTSLSSWQLAKNFISPATWAEILNWCHVPSPQATNPAAVNLPFFPIFFISIILAATSWLGGATWLVFRRGKSWTDALIEWGWYGWLWWCLVDVWEWLWIATGTAGLSNLAELLSVTPQFWLAGCFAGWLTTFLTLQAPSVLTLEVDFKPIRTKWLWLVCGCYAIVFITMNWQLYFNLLVPHGDSAMYEEHLWNLLHGKGFRSYLDRGLFLGEHIQFVHLFLLPLYALWPSHLLLEALSTIVLTLGAFPVFWMTRRQTGSDRTALAASVAYLLYFPMQFLDIEIDLKTFRPESFGIPLLLLTLDQLDRKNLVGTILGIAACLTVKEDYTLIFGPLGLWIAFSRATKSSNDESERSELLVQRSVPARQDGQVSQNPVPPLRRLQRNSVFEVIATIQGALLGRGLPSSGTFHDRKLKLISGLSLSLFSVVYLWLAMRVLMPWFRSGVEVHYASYFARFGSSPEKILRTWLTKPWLVSDALLTTETAVYAIALLAPLAFLPLLAPGRLAVGFPLFAILCMNELEASRTPQHQFHAPLVAIVFWSLAAALPQAAIAGNAILKRFGLNAAKGSIDLQAILRRLVWTSSLATGFFFSLGPLGIPFWDAGSRWYWQKLYVISDRAKSFDRVAAMIPQSARVASTDFVHPRFTHNDRSYDYSDYFRKVNAEGKRIPEDTEYIVIDTRHEYSKIKLPSQVPEFRDEPDLWELLPDETEGYFIVLKRK